MNLTYVTGNYGKYVSVREKFLKENMDIAYFKMDLEELDINDIKLISKKKAIDAYQVIKSPVFVMDSGFYIKNYPQNPGYPGAFVKRSGISKDVDKLLKVMEKVENRECFFLDCLTYFDGENFYQFWGRNEGVLAKEKRGDSLNKAWSNLWLVFIPKNCALTLAEMSDYERLNRPDNRTSATLEFINWYKKREKMLTLKK